MKNLSCNNKKFKKNVIKVIKSPFSENRKIPLLEEFKINFDKKTTYDEFKTQIEKNIKITNNPEIKSISSAKLMELLKAEGVEKTESEIDVISKIVDSQGKSNETLRYMALDEYTAKYKQNLGNQRAKFMMPLGWGWAFPLVKYTSMFLIAVKTSTAIPWMPFFIVCGFAVRIVFLPMMIRQMVLIQRMAKVSPNIKLLTYCTLKSNLTLSKKAYYFSRSLLTYCRDVKVNPLTFAAYNLFQLPIFFLMIMSIRKISFEEDLKGTGLLWFKNLNEPDPYMILPILSVALTYYNLGRGINKDNEHWFINRWRSFFQVLQICYLPFTCSWPAGSHIYWITSTALTFLQQSVLRHPKVMVKINPSFYDDMQKVFHTERNKEDSERYIEKLKKCEDTIIKSPTSNRKVLHELNYEKTRMNLYLKNLRYRKKIANQSKSIWQKIRNLLRKTDK